MSYHLDSIDAGVYGDVSKITEEYQEFMDAVRQGSKIMELVELSDLIGAIEGYLEAEYDMHLSELLVFSKITKRAFESGERAPK